MLAMYAGGYVRNSTNITAVQPRRSKRHPPRPTLEVCESSLLQSLPLWWAACPACVHTDVEKIQKKHVRSKTCDVNVQSNKIMGVLSVFRPDAVLRESTSQESARYKGHISSDGGARERRTGG